jgi:hypothetical protein
MGKFPVRSRKGNSYVMVCYVYDCNNVKVIPMKSRSPQNGSKPMMPSIRNSLSRVSNQNSKLLTANNVDYQLVPPHCHRCNAAERAIRAFKEHFMAGLSSVDPTFPLHLWDRLLPQAEITLHLLRTSSADLEAASATIRRSSLSWPRGLQQNSFCSARMQIHRTRETRKATHLGTPRATWIFLGSRNASLLMSKCIHLINSQ